MATSSESPDNWEIWHRRLGHPSPTAMYRLVKECMAKGVSIPDSLLKQCKSRRCECCILGKQSHLPFPLSKTRTARPLEIVHADICGKMEQETNSGGRYFLSVMDDFSKYSEVVILKKKSEAKHALIEEMTRWENLTEQKVKYLRTDGGKEFTGKLVTDFCTSKGITHQVTPRHTPQSNGKIERLNRTFKEKVRCILIDSRIDVEWWGYALEYAAYLRNRLPASGKGLTPYELFFNTQPDLSLVRVFGCKAYVKLEKKDAAFTKLGPQCETGIFLGMEPGTKAYRVLIGTEIRVSRHVVFSEEKHKSAGTVVGPMPVEHEEYDEVPDLTEDDYVWIAEVRREQPYIDPFMSAEYREARTGETHLLEEGTTDDEATGPATVPPRVFTNMPEDSDDEIPELLSADEDSDSDNDTDGGDDGDADYSGTALRNQTDGAVLLDASDASQPAAATQAVGATNRYPLRSKGPVRAELVIALNAMALTVSSDMSEVIVPKSYAEAMRTDQKKYWDDAMTDEINSILSKETFTWVPRPLNTKVIPTRWVYAVKHDAMGNIQRFKGRVVAKGFKQELGIDFNETYAPVCDQNTRRVLFAIAAQRRLHMHQMDVKTAFLNGELTDLTYCEPPPGYSGERGMVWKLHKALYGLKQAPRAWHECLVKALVAGDFVVTNADPGLFIKTTKAGLIYLITYVDDIIVCGADLTEVQIVKKYLSGVFEVTDLGEVAHFLGNVVVRNSNSVRVSNPVKVKELLADYGIDNPRKVTTPMDPSFVVTEMSVEAGKIGGSGKPLSEGNRYNELIGSLMYLANTTRPDLSLAVGLLSRFRSKPTTAHWSAGLRVLAYLFYTPDLGLEFCGDHDIVGYVDSAFADDKDACHSTMGYTFLLNGAAVSWASKKQRGIAHSTVEAEYCAFHLAACHALWLQLLLHEMIGRKGSITIYCDSTGCISNLKNFMTSGHTKHIGVKYHAARQMVAKQQIVPVYVQTDENIADVFTKPLANTKFSKFVNGLGMT
jgi:transposase InsO family protein